MRRRASRSVPFSHHGKRKERGGEMRYADKSERVKFSSARGLAGDPEDRGRWTADLMTFEKIIGEANEALP